VAQKKDTDFTHSWVLALFKKIEELGAVGFYSCTFLSTD